MTLITRIEREYTPPPTVKTPFYKLCFWALAEWIETKLPPAWKYQLLRRWLTAELIAAGWAQDAKEPNRLWNDSKESDYLGPKSRISMAEHEAIARHFKEFPLRSPDQLTP